MTAPLTVGARRQFAAAAAAVTPAAAPATDADRVHFAADGYFAFVPAWSAASSWSPEQVPLRVRELDLRATAARASERADALTKVSAVGSPALVEVEELQNLSAAQDGLVALEADSEVRRTARARAQTERSLWFDDEAAAREALGAFHRSAEYRELHRKSLTHSGLGLYGGEAGFEKSPRTWVDPDRPHVKNIFTNAPLNANKRYANYGHFRWELQTIDYDKLTRHGRKLPLPSKLLTDAISGRVALSDHNASAIIFHGARVMIGMHTTMLQDTYRDVEQTFERMLVTSLPGIEVGVKTHAAMIRVCTRAGRFKEGYEWFWQRALEEAADFAAAEAALGGNGKQLSDADNRFELTADIFDAVVDLCVQTGHYVEALTEFERAVSSGRRLRVTTLNAALHACARLRLHAVGESVWELYGHYRRVPDERSFEAWAACVARAVPKAAPAAAAKLLGELSQLVDKATGTLEAQRPRADRIRQIDQVPVVVSANTYAWVCHGLAVADPAATRGAAVGKLVLRLMAGLAGRGDSPSVAALTMALEYCALHHEDGASTALAIWREHIVRSDKNASFDMLLLLARAVAFGDEPVTVEAFRTVADAMHVARERTGSHDDRLVRFDEDEQDAAIPMYGASRSASSLLTQPLSPAEERDEEAVGAGTLAVARARRGQAAVAAAMLTMCARLGAVAEAASLLGRLVVEADGDESTAVMRLEGDNKNARDASAATVLRHPPTLFFTLALTANAKAASGSHRLTKTFLDQFFSMTTSDCEITSDLIDALCACRRAHGKIPESSPLFTLLCECGLPEAEVSLMELMDARDLLTTATTAAGSSASPAVAMTKEGLRRDVLAFAVNDTAEAALLKRAAEPLQQLRRDRDTEAFALIVQPYRLDPFSMRDWTTSIFIDAGKIGIKKLGQFSLPPQEDKVSAFDLARRWQGFYSHALEHNEE